MTTSQPKFDSGKLDELILYISARNLVNEHFGKTKLHKLLWMSDFRYFGLTGKAITGARYINRQFGPFCEQLPQALNRLEDAGRLAIRERNLFEHSQLRPTPLKRADLSRFSAEEIAAVEDVLWETWDSSTRELSSRSHLHPGWAWTNEGDVIGYEFALVPVDEPFEEPYVPQQRPQAAAGD